MCSKQNRKFKSKHVQHDYRNKWMKNFNKKYNANVNVDLMEENVIQINARIAINVNANVKMSCMWKRLYLESFYM